MNSTQLDDIRLPSSDEMQHMFRQKYGESGRVGWSPARRRQFDYYPPADVYEALLTNLVFDGCAWIDIGGGSSLFPDNPRLAEALAARASQVVAVDPSCNVLENVYAKKRVQTAIENYETDRTFDLATLRMVAEHIAAPELVVSALRRLLRPGGITVVFTVNCWSPASVVSLVTPLPVHHFVKKLLWGTEERDTFPVEYRMNTRRQLRGLFEAGGFQEVAFAYLDDLSIGSQFRVTSYVELCVWKALQKIHIPYPENCLLGLYKRG